MRIDRFLIHSFDKEKSNFSNEVEVPQGSKLLKIVIMNDGIYGYYEVTELENIGMQKETFIIMKPDQSIPENSEFIDVLDVVIQTKEQGQGIIVMPIYRLKA